MEARNSSESLQETCPKGLLPGSIVKAKHPGHFLEESEVLVISVKRLYSSLKDLTSKGSQKVSSIGISTSRFLQSCFLYSCASAWNPGYIGAHVCRTPF